MEGTRVLHAAVKRLILITLCLGLLAGLSAFIRAEAADEPEASPDAVRMAAETDAAIAAIKNVTLRSEEKILAARAMYDALPEEAKALVTKTAVLEKAERTLRSLKDRDAASKIKKLIDARRFDEAIELAEEYMAGQDPSEAPAEVMTRCLQACARKAAVMMRDGEYERTDAYLQECRERYAGADLTELDRALASLDRAIGEPESGAVLAGIKGEYGTVTVRAGDSPALVKIVSLSDPKNALTVYVRAGETAAVHVKDGNYTLRYATGDKWYGEDELFGSATRFYSVDTVLRFSTDRVGRDIFSQNYRVEISASADGAISAVPTEADRF